MGWYRTKGIGVESFSHLPFAMLLHRKADATTIELAVSLLVVWWFLVALVALVAIAAQVRYEPSGA